MKVWSSERELFCIDLFIYMSVIYRYNLVT